MVIRLVLAASGALLSAWVVEGVRLAMFELGMVPNMVTILA